MKTKDKSVIKKNITYIETGHISTWLNLPVIEIHTVVLEYTNNLFVISFIVGVKTPGERKG